MSAARTRSDAWGLTAILAACALLVQVLLPSVAVAYAARDGGALVQICSGGELKTRGDAHKSPPKGFAGLRCAECVMASVAGVAPPSPPIPVRMGVAVHLRLALDLLSRVGQRSPPRIREQSPRAPPSV